MSKRMLAISLMMLSVSATATRADNEVASLTKQLNELNCLVESQREKGYPLALKAERLVENFAKASAKNQTAERYRAIVQLTAALLPCAVESESAFIVDDLRDKPGFRKAFDAALLKVPACKIKNLIAAIKEGDDDDQDPSKTKPPKAIFSYSECVTGRDPQSTK